MLHSITALKKVEHHIDEGIDGLTPEQAKIIEGAITFQTVPCNDVMTNIGKVDLMLGFNTVVDEKCMEDIRRDGKSRIPICLNDDKNKIVAFLLAKSVVGVDPTKKKTVK